MKSLFLVLGLSICLATPVTAHHARANIFDTEADIVIEGVISSLDYRNPHIQVGFTVDEGTPYEKQYWTESGSVAQLTRMGITKELLAVGTPVRVAGHPSRADDNGISMNNVLLPSGQEMVFGLGGTPRWSGVSSRIGSTDRLIGRVIEEDFSKRPTTIFSVWNTIYGAQGSHHAFELGRGAFGIQYAEPRGIGDCQSKDVWTEMGSPYPIQIIDNHDGTITVHVEEFDTIRSVYMDIDHNDPGTVKNNLGYSTGFMEDGKLFVTTTFEGSNSPIEFNEMFQLSEDHNRLEYTGRLSNTETGDSVDGARWWEYQPNAFVQPYDCHER